MQTLYKPMLINFQPRIYQESILGTCTLNNSLVVLPTGLGKTAIGMMLAAHRLRLYPDSKIVFLAPTKPLVEQHKKSFSDHLPIAPDKLVIFTGEIPPKKRQVLWNSGQIFFSTPQGFENDVIGNKIKLTDVSLIIFDEAHHAVGEYAYVFIAKQYDRYARHPRILGLTASPGSDVEKIQEVCNNLFIESVEVRTENDSDVKQYVQIKTVTTRSVTLPDSYLTIKKYFVDCMKSKLVEVKSYGLISKTDFVSKRELLGIQAHLVSLMTSGHRDFETLKSVSLLSEVLKVHHALELLETQGVQPLHDYIERIFVEAPSSKTKAVKNLVRDTAFKSAYVLTKDLIDKGVLHPKLAVLKETLEKAFSEDPFGKAIVFTQYRDTADAIKKFITSKNIIPSVFIGQSKRKTKGFSQKKQKEVLDQFKDGFFNVLIATSVAEEGLDIPSVDTVVFYEPIPSAIRSIQRSGRTARHKEGRVVILVAKGTRDEAYKWSAFHKEKKMYRFLNTLKKNLVLAPRSNESLQKYVQPEKRITVFADYREKGSALTKELIEQNVELNLETLNSADYILSSRVGVEIKKVQDFVDSIVDGRLLLQLKELKRNFERPLLIIEGGEDLYSIRNVHPNAIRGMLATITVSYGIPILQTRHAKESAGVMLSIAKREQEETGKDFSYHFEKRSLSEKQIQEYIVSSLPNVGGSVAKDLLNHFGSVEKVITASEQQLKEVPGVGKIIAKRVREILGREYE